MTDHDCFDFLGSQRLPVVGEYANATMDEERPFHVNWGWPYKFKEGDEARIHIALHTLEACCHVSDVL